MCGLQLTVGPSGAWCFGKADLGLGVGTTYLPFLSVMHLRENGSGSRSSGGSSIDTGSDSGGSRGAVVAASTLVVTVAAAEGAATTLLVVSLLVVVTVVSSFSFLVALLVSRNN